MHLVNDIYSNLIVIQDDCGKKADIYQVKYILNEPAKREKSTTKKGSAKSTDTPTLEDTIFDAKSSWLGI